MKRECRKIPAVPGSDMNKNKLCHAKSSISILVVEHQTIINFTIHTAFINDLVEIYFQSRKCSAY